jgi:aldose sugar dehydrogenase
MYLFVILWRKNIAHTNKPVLVLCLILMPMQVANVAAQPILNDSNLKAETVTEGLDLPTSMAFLGPDDILVLEKDSGKVRRVLNGSVFPQPLLDVPVATERERGILGVAVANKTQSGTIHPYVLIFFTQSKSSKDAVDNCSPSWPYYCEQKNEPLGNRLYRYEVENNRLVNPKLLMDLPATPGPSHNGGVILIGPDGNAYVTVGDIRPQYDKDKKLGNKATNIIGSQEPDGRSGILRITPEGHTVGNGILGKTHPLDKYYAYGIRNSFGIDFDPLTGNLWDTENGPVYGDEINLVEPGFNSGWGKVQGVWKNNSNSTADILARAPTDLISFNGKGNYSDPEFEWRQPVGPTALKFLDSDKLGEEYENDMFVGDINNGNLYHFELNDDRTELALTEKLEDRVANTSTEINDSDMIFGQGFGGTTDIEVGPYDGYLYVVSHTHGKIFRILPEH